MHSMELSQRSYTHIDHYLVLPISTKQVDVVENGLIEAAETPKKVMLNSSDFKFFAPRGPALKNFVYSLSPNNSICFQLKFPGI